MVGKKYQNKTVLLYRFYVRLPSLHRKFQTCRFSSNIARSLSADNLIVLCNTKLQHKQVGQKKYVYPLRKLLQLSPDSINLPKAACVPSELQSAVHTVRSSDATLQTVHDPTAESIVPERSIIYTEPPDSPDPRVATMFHSVKGPKLQEKTKRKLCAITAAMTI